MDTEAAFASLVTQHERRIYGLCYRMLGNSDEARDVSQEVFIAAWKGLSRFRAESSAYTWLYRIAVNLSLRRRRTLGRFRRAIARFAGFAPATSEFRPEGKPGIAPAAVSLDGAPNRYQPERAAETSEQRRALERAMDVLTPDQRAAVLLRDRDGLSYEELSRVLDWKAGTVKSRISRARGALAIEIQRIAPDFAPRRKR